MKDSPQTRNHNEKATSSSDEQARLKDMLRWCTTFLGQGPQSISLVHSRAKDTVMKIMNFRESSLKNRFFKFNNILFIACGLILLPSELFRNVISCKIVNSSMKFKFIHKIFVIHEQFLVFFNLLRGPALKLSGTGSGPRVAGCASLCYRFPHSKFSNRLVGCSK